MPVKDGDYHETGKIENRISKDSNEGIDFFFSYFDIDDKEGAFVIHVSPRTYTPGERLSRWHILTRLGFSNSRDCPVFGRHPNGCYYKSINVNRYDVDKTDLKNSHAFQQYKWLCNNLADLCQRIKEVNGMLEKRGLKFPWPKDDFPYGVIVKIPEETWIDKNKSVEQKALEERVQESTQRIEELSVIMGVLYQADKDLEIAVEALLRDLDLEPELQDTIDESAPIDIKVTLSGDEPRRFAFEVTGSKNGVRHRDQKAHDISTYLRYERQDRDEKVVLLANTFYELDPDERRDKLHFSKQVTHPLEEEGVLLMTTVQLYDIWRGVKEGKLNLHEVVEEMYSQAGEFKNA